VTTIQIPLKVEDTNKDGKVSLGERVQAALVLWAVLFLALNILYLCIVVVLNKQRAGALWLTFWLPAFVALDTVAVAALAVWRLIIYERAEREERAERRRRWDREDWEMDQVKGISKSEGETRWTQATQDYYAQLYLKRYYQGKGLERNRWEADGLPQPAWNRINKLMQQYKIRKARSKVLEFETFAEAWGAWCEAEMTSRRWVKNGDGYLKD